MAIYNSLPILDALISDVQRDPFCQSSIKAMVSDILIYYFPVTDNFAVCYKEAQGGCPTHFLVRRLHSNYPGQRLLVDHLVVVTRAMYDSTTKSETDLKHILAHTEMEGPRCWAMAFYGSVVQIFMYDSNAPGEEWLLPWKLPGQVMDQFHLREDGEAVDWRLRRMRVAADARSRY